MQFLFDKFASASAEFRPKTAAEFLALRLALKLDDAPAVRHYRDLADSHTESQLLTAYRRSLRGKANGNFSRLFHRELEHTHASGSRDGSVPLISIRVERRAIAAAVFRGDRLEYTDARQLSSAHGKALDSTVGFINWMLDHFTVESAALEAIPNGYEFQRRVLHDAICHEFRERMLPIWEIPKTVLLESCGYPPLKTRAELREVVTTIWPVLAGTHAKVLIQDAAILGLHVQIERLFMG